MRHEGYRGRLCKYLLCVCANKIYLVALSRCPTRLNSRNYLPPKLPAQVTYPETYISQAYVLDRHAALIGHISHRPTS